VLVTTNPKTLPHQSTIIIKPPDDHGYELLYISVSGDIEKPDSICISKSPHDKYLLILPHLEDTSEFFVISKEDRKKIIQWLTDGDT
jgi:hypothetical protein